MFLSVVPRLLSEFLDISKRFTATAEKHYTLPKSHNMYTRYLGHYHFSTLLSLPTTQALALLPGGTPLVSCTKLITGSISFLCYFLRASIRTASAWLQLLRWPSWLGFLAAFRFKATDFTAVRQGVLVCNNSAAPDALLNCILWLYLRHKLRNIR